MPIKAVVDTLDDVPAAFHELYTERNGKFELTGVEGFKTQADIDRVQSALTKERNDHKAVKDKFAPFAELGDPAAVLTKLDRIAELELAAAGKLDETKLEEIITTRMKSKTAPLERELATHKTKVAELEGVVTGYKQKEVQGKISDSVRAAAKKAGMVDGAVEDAILLGERILTLDESGQVVTKDNVGVTPGVVPEVWLTDLKQSRAHWWGPTQGGGAGGGRGAGGFGGANPFSKDGWNMTEQGKLIKENHAKAVQMATAAGTKIGGPRPK
jgi:hypothetical protein